MAEVGSVKTASEEPCVDVSLRLAEHAHYVRLDDQVIVADMRSGHYLGLDGVGARVWDLIVEGASRDVIVERLSAEYEVAVDVLAQDVERLVEELMERRLVQTDVLDGRRVVPRWASSS